MICVECGKDCSTVIDSRLSEATGQTRRRRYKCKYCGTRWTTLEVVVEDEGLVDFVKNGKNADNIKRAIVLLEEVKDILTFDKKGCRKTEEQKTAPTRCQPAEPVDVWKDEPKNTSVSDFARQIAEM